MICTFLAPRAFAGLVEMLWCLAGGAGLKLLRLNGGRGPRADRRKAVDTLRFWRIGVGWACGGTGSVLGVSVLEISSMDTIVRVRSRAYWCDSKHEYQSDNRNDSPGHSRRIEHRPLSLS